MRLWMNVQRSSGTESIYQRAEPSCYMHVLIFVATCIEHIWFCCNISFVFTTGIHELKRVEAILSSFRKDMAFSLYKSWNRLCEIDAYECTYFSEKRRILFHLRYMSSYNPHDPRKLSFVGNSFWWIEGFIFHSQVSQNEFTLSNDLQILLPATNINW